MSVTLQAINANGTALGSSVTIYPTGLSRQVKDKKLVQPLPANHLLVPLGKEGPTITVKFRVTSTTDFTNTIAWVGGTKLNVTASGELEMPATVGSPSTAGSTGVTCEIWNVDDIKTERNGGYVNVWDVSMSITRYWNWKVA